MAAKSTAYATWEHDLLKGNGTVRPETGAFGTLPVTWSARSEQHNGKTSPEELLAAAHASCYAMALSGGLGRLQKPADRLNVTATATFDKVGDAWKVTTMDLSVVGKVPGITAAQFEEAAHAAKDGCPISKALHGNVQVNLTAKLE
ncbi:MAG: OsmC family peroxiredoxin [Thermoplasmata archaeon]